MHTLVALKHKSDSFKRKQYHFIQQCDVKATNDIVHVELEGFPHQSDYLVSNHIEEMGLELPLT